MVHSPTMCKYYLQENFNNELLNHPERSFSLCHINVRSLQQNFSSMQAFLDNLNINFTILGITETWLTDINCDLYNISNYSLVEKHRTTRSGGGVGIYIPENVEYKYRRDITKFDDILESELDDIF